MRISRGAFVRWLSTKKPDEIVGLSRDSCGCPIARFHNEIGGVEITIFEDANRAGYIVDRGYSRHPLPFWAEVFVSKVDGDEGKNITASRALEVLGEDAR